MASTCTLFNIQRFSTEDGPGIRTTLFFKGCPLICPWCHNPEGLKRQRRVVWQPVHCIGCGDGEAACPESAISRFDGRVVIDTDKCQLCGTCVEACPAAALEIVGTEYTVEGLLAESLKDRTFYEKSGGGITLSGGEPLMQQPFLLEFLPRCREAGLHVALDTCGIAKKGALDPVLGMVDLVLFDIKLIDPEAHKRFTGVGLDAVLENLDKVARAGLPLWARTPVIPSMTDSPENIRGIAELLHERTPNLERYDLLAFSNLCTSKYEMFGSRFPLEGQPLFSAEEMEKRAELARDAGLDCVRWSGPTHVETTKGEDS